jgi:hypothetical protein
MGMGMADTAICGLCTNGDMSGRRRAYRQPVEGEEPVHVVHGEIGRQGQEAVVFLYLKKTDSDN